MEESVEDGIGDRGISDPTVPVFDGRLSTISVAAYRTRRYKPSNT
jgi:hypothetical protein